MGKDNKITILIVTIMAAAVVFCLVMIACSGKLDNMLGGSSLSMEYETRLFDTDKLISIDIQMDEEEWEKMQQNALSEEYYVCDATINGLKLYNVAIRPKGNTSLSAIAADPDSDRYSLKLEFGHFVEGQSCYGLDKLILNNNYADATNMKEAIIYDMYQYIGADASLYNYAEVSLNGEYVGVYLALEAVEQSFMLRVYGTQDGELYKPDSMEMGGDKSSSSSSKSGFGGMTPPTENFNFDPGNMPEMPGGGDFNFDQGNLPEMPGGGNFDFNPENMPEMPGGGDFNFDPGNMPDMSGNGKFSFGLGNEEGKRGGGANLNYNGDDLDNYSTIWEGSITATADADHSRVVKALKNISEGTDLDKYLDIDNILKYMAVHTFAVNMDSLSGSMAHNYYLYEYNGQLNIIPWDYNLSFGGMSMGNSANATEMVNDAIDTPFSGTKFFDALLENEEYLAKYHEYLQMLVDEYVNGGRFDEVYERIRSQIDDLVATDPTAFYSGEEYEKAASILYEVVKLRAESIDGQLNGTIPSTDSGQKEDSSALIDASHINVKDMGEFNMGGRGGNSDESADGEKENAGGVERRGGRGKSMQGGFNPGNMPDFGGSAPDGARGSGAGKNLAIYGGCLGVMIVMIVVAAGYKRRKWVRGR